MSAQLVLRGSKNATRRAKPGQLARLFQWMDQSEKAWRARHAREVARVLSLGAESGERGFWRAD